MKTIEQEIRQRLEAARVPAGWDVAETSTEGDKTMTRKEKDIALMQHFIVCDKCDAETQCEEYHRIADTEITDEKEGEI
jgi:hypothetical protein